MEDSSPIDKPRRVETVELFGVPIRSVTMNQVVECVHASSLSRRSMNIGVVNAAKIVNMRKDPELSEAVLSSDDIYADGMSVVWASRILGHPLPERIAGIDLMHEIMALASANKLRVFCLGAKQEILDKVIAEFTGLYPGAVIAGSHHGYFNEDGEALVADKIREANADILFVAITSPKKERFMAKWSAHMRVPVVHGVGGSFDVVAGLVERAPESWQRLGLEWLYRVKQEPRRLWKRYFVTNSVFIGMIVKQLISPK